MTSAYLWVKVFHIFFVIAWMVGIFYLPRMFVHFQEAVQEGEGVSRIKTMARKLYKFSTIMMIFAIILGLTLWLHFGMGGGWMHAKLLLVLYFVVHHHLCGYFLKQMQKDTLKPSSVFFRWFNELPVFVLLGILILTLMKPF